MLRRRDGLYLYRKDIKKPDGAPGKKNSATKVLPKLHATFKERFP